MQKLSRTQIFDAIQSLVNTTRWTKGTATSLNSRFISEIYSQLHSRTESGKRRYTLSDVSYAQGVFDTLYRQLWQEVEFVYRSKDGTIYGTNRNSIYPYWQDHASGAELDNMERAHVWIGTDKHYTKWGK